MYGFKFARADDLGQAARLLSQHPGSKPLAGGMSLLPVLKHRLASPDLLIDLSRIANLSDIALVGDRLRIGAMARHYQVAASPLVADAIPALGRLAGGIGDVQVRYRGTIGGSLANADPSADYPAAAVGLGATIITDQRSIEADAFFTGLFETALHENELITAVDCPRPDRAVYLKFPNLASRYAIVGLFMARFGEQVRIAVTGAASSVFRLTDAEAILTDDFSAQAITQVALGNVDLINDVHASASYRAHLVSVLVRKAAHMLSDNSRTE